MNSINQVTLDYDLEGINLTIIAEVIPGEPMTEWSPGFDDEIESVKISGERIAHGAKLRYELPDSLVDEMREKWSIDDLIYDEIKGIKSHRRAV